MLDRKEISEELGLKVRLLKENPLSVLSITLVVGLLLVAMFAPWIAPYEQYTLPEIRLLPPTFDHPFGTDEFGRDVLGRVVWGTRISFFAGFVTLTLGAIIGVPLGLCSGYLGKTVDQVIMRSTDIFLSIPPLILAILVTATLGADIGIAMIAMAVTLWPRYARLTRGMTLSMRERPFIEAAKAYSASPIRILFRHILPNILGPLTTEASLDIGRSILTLSMLGFLGLAAQPPTPEWGSMIATGRRYVPTFWWCSVFPGLAITAAVLGFNLMGDALRDLMDPRLRR